MLSNQLAVKYAHAMYDLAVDQNILELAETQLKDVENSIASHDDLRELMYNPMVPVKAKKEVIGELFASDLHEYVRNFLCLLVDKHRETALPAVVREFVRRANEARNIAEAEVVTAMALGEQEQCALVEKLSAVTGKKIILKTSVDAGLIGGMIVKMGDKLIDGSVKRQIQAMREALLAAEVTKIGVTD